MPVFNPQPSINLAVPGPIGGTTPSTIAGTAITASSLVMNGPISGTGLVNGVVTTDSTSNTATFGTGVSNPITNLSFAIGANETWFGEYSLRLIGPAGGGIKLQFSGPASPTLVSINMAGSGTNLTSLVDEVQSSFGGAVSIFVSGSTITGLVLGTITVINGANAGTVQLQYNNTLGGGTATMKAGSTLTARKLS